MADSSVQTCVTSPPYFNLRDYGIAGQIGLEGTPEAYVARLVEVFRAVRRILRDDGTVWLNLGDSFGAGKQLQMIPHRVAIALQDDGWVLRADVVWHKPNPMPESVRDRPTRAHEYIFLLAKRQEYYYDADAIREPCAYDGPRGGRIPRPGVDVNGGNQGLGAIHTDATAGRNKRDVWTVTTKPCREAHFATFPPDLIEPCILAGTSEKGACPDCGAPRQRVTERTPIDYGMGSADTTAHKSVIANGNAKRAARTPTGHSLSKTRSSTTGWEPSCTCGRTDTVPCVVFDPFAGAGTTGLVAVRHGRAFAGIELNPEYAAIARRRIAEAAAQPRLAGVA